MDCCNRTNTANRAHLGIKEIKTWFLYFQSIHSPKENAVYLVARLEVKAPTLNRIENTLVHRLYTLYRAPQGKEDMLTIAKKNRLPPYQVSKTISSSMTFAIKCLGVLSTYAPRVSTLPSLPPGILKGRTSLARASAASGPHSEQRKESFRLEDSLSEKWTTIQHTVFCAVVAAIHYVINTWRSQLQQWLTVVSTH